MGSTIPSASAQTPPTNSVSTPFVSAPHLPAPAVTVEPEQRQLASDPSSTGQGTAPTSSVATVHSNVGRRDFGTVNALDTPQVTHDFILHNDTTASLIVTRLQSSCGCTTASIQALLSGKATDSASSAAEATSTTATIAPGQRARVHVTLNLTGHAPGMLYKTVLVFAEGHFQPVALLEMQGQLQPAVSFSPSFLDFGHTAGGSVPQIITATVDARLVPSGQLPALMASNPAITVTPVPVSTASTPGTKTLSRTYHVSLAPDTPLGPLTATLTFGPPVSKNTLPSAAAAPFAQAVALVVGQVTGDLSASPDLLSFGNLPEGTTKDLSVTLTGTTAKAVKGLTVQSGSPWLLTHLSEVGTAKLPPTGGLAPVPMRQLTVTLSPQAPHGVQQTQVTVTLASGRRLVLPVTVYVMPPLPTAKMRPASVQPIAAIH